MEIYVNIDHKTVKFGMKPPCMQSLILDLPASDMHLLLMGGGGEADYIISTGGGWDGCGLFFFNLSKNVCVRCRIKPFFESLK